MSLLALLQAVLGLAGSLTAYLKDKQLLDAGEALAISKGLQDAQTSILKAKQARITANSKFDKSDGVPDDTDPNLRD